MNRISKRIIALFLCCIMIFGLTACHKANETALTIGEVEFTSAFYSCALVFADLEGQQLVYDTLGEEAYADYLNQTLDGVDYKTWVKNRAIENCKNMAAYKIRCDELLLTCDDYVTADVNTADLYWSGYGYSAMMSENGVGRGTFRSYMSMDSYRKGYFDYIYGEGGEKEIPAADIEAELTANYAIANMLTVDASSLTDDELNTLVAELEAYAERIRQGEKFDKIYAEYNGTTYTENTEQTGTFSYDYASVLGNEGTDYASDYFAEVNAMSAGEIKVVTLTDDSDSENVIKTVLLLYKADILSEENTLLSDLKKVAMHSLKDEEFENGMQEFINSLTVNENTRATKQFKVDKIVYPS